MTVLNISGNVWTELLICRANCSKVRTRRACMLEVDGDKKEDNQSVSGDKNLDSKNSA